METLAISCLARQSSVRFPRAPPYSSGTHCWSRPMSPKIGTSSSGKRSVSSISAAIGATCRSTIFLMLSTNAVCSSVRYMDVSLIYRIVLGLGAAPLAQHAGRVDVLAQDPQFFGRRHRGDRGRPINHEFETGLLLNLLDRRARMQRPHAHSF